MQFRTPQRHRWTGRPTNRKPDEDSLSTAPASISTTPTPLPVEQQQVTPIAPLGHGNDKNTQLQVPQAAAAKLETQLKANEGYKKEQSVSEPTDIMKLGELKDVLETSDVNTPSPLPPNENAGTYSTPAKAVSRSDHSDVWSPPIQGGFVVGREIDAVLDVIDKVMAEKKDEADITADMKLRYFEEKMLDTSYIQGYGTGFIRELHKLSENKNFIMRVVKKILGAGQTHSREDIYSAFKAVQSCIRVVANSIAERGPAPAVLRPAPFVYDTCSSDSSAPPSQPASTCPSPDRGGRATSSINFSVPAVSSASATSSAPSSSPASSRPVSPSHATSSAAASGSATPAHSPDHSSSSSASASPSNTPTKSPSSAAASPTHSHSHASSSSSSPSHPSTGSPSPQTSAKSTPSRTRPSSRRSSPSRSAAPSSSSTPAVSAPSSPAHSHPSSSSTSSCSYPRRDSGEENVRLTVLENTQAASQDAQAATRTTTMSLTIEKIGLKAAESYVGSYITVTLVGKDGKPIEPPINTPKSAHHLPSYVVFECTVTLQTPFEQFDRDTTVFLELKHFKDNHVFCFTLLERDEMDAVGVPVTLEIYKEPTLWLKEDHSFEPLYDNNKPLYMHITIHTTTR